MVDPSLQSLDFLVRGMDCAEETSALRAELDRLAGVRSLAFDILNRKMTVQVEQGSVPAETIVAAVARTGMTAEPWAEHAAGPAPADAGRGLRSATTAASGLVLVAAFIVHAAAAGWRSALGSEDGATVPVLARGGYLAAAVLGAWFVLPKAWHALRRMRPDMNLLMCVAVAGAVAIGQWLEAATVAFLFAISLALELWSVGRARHAIAALIELSPTQARVIGEGHDEQMVDAASVPVGSRLSVKPGEKFPLDGRIVRGRTSVNQAPITGESMPVSKVEGSEVFAGTLNEEGAVEVRTEKAYADSTLSQIAKMVGEAHGRRAQSEQWVERFARVYTPCVMACALLVAVLPPLFGGSWVKWLYEGLTLLVIACPCALVISTPVAIVAALATAASRGILVKGGVHLETAAKVVVFAFDKTGTLTEGNPKVGWVVPCVDHDRAEVLRIAAAIEVNSTHPLARAIVECAAAEGCRWVPATDFQAVPGKGAHAMLDGVPHWVGSHRHLEERGQESAEAHEELERLAALGASIVVIGREDHVCGYIALADMLRPNAQAAIQALRNAGIQRIVMLSGDNRPTAEVIRSKAGMDEAYAELLPADKVRIIEELVQRYGVVAMVGDGVNDAPALARSSLGIAMGVAGTDAALETADIALMGDDLSGLAWLVRFSQRTLRTVRQNIGASLAVKAVFVLLCILGHASLWGAIASDMGVSLLVVLNALRLLHPKANMEL